MTMSTASNTTPEQRADRRRALARARVARHCDRHHDAIRAKQAATRRRRYAEDPAYRARCVETQRQIRAKRRAAKAAAAELGAAAPEVAAA